MDRILNQEEKPDLAKLFAGHKEGLAGAVRGILGRRADVQEILQEAFVRAWKVWNTGSAGSIEDPVAWVFVLTMNVARDQRRKGMRRRPSVQLEEVDPVKMTSTDPNPLQRLQSHEWVRAARDAILDLEEAEKEVFVLRVSGGRTFSSIAEALGIPEGTAKTRMRSALRRLRQTLKGYAPIKNQGSLGPVREDS